MLFSRALFAIFLCALVTAAWSQSYPNKPIRLLVGFTAGGNADVSARVIAAKLAQALGTSIVVENRSGAAGSVAAQIVARAPADGYTLMLASPGALTVNRILEKNLPYDPDTAFVPIGMAVTFCNALTARPDFAASSVAQLIALAKDKPGQFNFGSQGVGSAGFLSGQLMQQMADIKLTHVPYKGGSDATTAVLGGELHMTFASATAALALRSRLKILAVTSPARDPSLPDVPTMDESGLKGYDATFWLGLAAPAGTPQAIVNRLNALLRDAVTDAEVVKTLQRQGLNPAPSSPQELTARMRADYVKWKRVIAGS
ncbi:MAG: Bug family tripartite tricarboxylate transporter substrate binding protein [Burkholderiales bacterium]